MSEWQAIIYVLEAKLIDKFGHSHLAPGQIDVQPVAFG